MGTAALNNITFYAACMSGAASPGFVAGKVQLAGSTIEGLGNICVWTADLLTNFGWSAGIISLFGMAFGKAVEHSKGGNRISAIAKVRLTEAAGFYTLGWSLAVLGGPMQYAGNYLTSQETQCRIGNAVHFKYKPREEQPKEEL